MSRKPESYDWLVAHKSHDGDACLIWPFSRNTETGRGQLGHGGKIVRAHRLMCEMVRGPAPSPKHHAAHDCGNGHLGCVNPKHLDWKTPAQNGQDRARHGRKASGTRKLTTEQVAEIVRLKGIETQEAIARRFGITRVNVSRIHHGGSWKFGIHPSAVEVRRLLGLNS